MMEKHVEVREATRDDCQQIRQLIQVLADFLKMPDSPKIDHQALQKYGFDDENPIFKCYVAVCEEKLVGYALYFYIHATLDRKAVHLEDLYVRPEFRKKHIGSRLFDSVAKRTFDEKGQYLNFSVVSWNPAKGFFKAKGAVNMTEMEGWHFYRVEHESILHLATKSSDNNNYIVREATSSDFDFIRKLAEDASVSQTIRISNYKKPNFDQRTDDRIDEKFHDTQSNGYYGYLIVELNGRVIGYALHCCAYSTWEGKSMYLQELYVSPNEHLANMRFDLFSAVAKKACEQNCCRIDFWAMNSDNAGKFYTANGAIDLTESEEWNMFQLFKQNRKSA